MRRLAFLVVLVLLLCCSCELMFEAKDPAPEVGTLRVLVYGNDYNYSSLNPKYRLQGTVNDAVQVGMALTKLAQKAGVPCQTTYLVGRDLGNLRASISDSYAVYNDVTTDRFLSELSRIASESTSRDMFVVFFAGHGSGYGSKVGYGIDVSPFSGMVFNNSSNTDNVILRDSTFLSLVEAIEGTKLIIGDFCYSGALVSQDYVSVGTNEFMDMDINTLFGKRERIDVDPSLFVLSAARYYEKSYDKKDGSHGCFTSALLEAFGWNEESQALEASPAEKSGMMTLHNIARYVIKNDDKALQNPMLSGGSNDLVLFDFR